MVRRHPDGKWRHRPGDVERFAGEQARLLPAAWPLLAPGGRGLCATGSVFRAEDDSLCRPIALRRPRPIILVFIADPP